MIKKIIILFFVSLIIYSIPSLVFAIPANALIGDVNGDCIVDNTDVTECQNHFGQNWPACDWNNDGIVDMDDLMIVGTTFGNTSPPFTPIGDVNGDFVVDNTDVTECQNHFGQNWPACDWNNDGIVDMDDLMIVGTKFGTSCLAPPVCVSDGCNGNCPAGCTVAQDPDCGCQNGNGCCGIGCAFATDNDCTPPPPPSPSPSGFLPNPLQFGSFQELIERIINFIFRVAVVIAPIMIIIAAFYFITSAGDPERVRTAKKIIFWTVVGLAIVLLARGIISMVRQIVGG